MIEGSCLCGAVSLRVHGELAGARYCHCGNCRKFSGASPAAWAMARTSQVERSGEDIGRFDSGRGIRCFCCQCGSPVWFESKDYPEIVGVPLGVLDSGDIPTPEVHLWVSSNPAWCEIVDDLPQFETIPSSAEASSPSPGPATRA